MPKTADSFRFLDVMSRRVVKSWIAMKKPRNIPWTPLSKPLSECAVALISSGGLALKADAPFDQEGERKNPWWGDPSYRVIPNTACANDIRVYHQHINPHFAEMDINCLLPVDRLAELVTAGEIGRAACSHYAFMGYILEPKVLLEETTPAIIRRLKDEAIDVVALVPA